MVGQYLDLPTPALRERAAGAVKAAANASAGAGAAGNGLIDGMRGLRVDDARNGGGSKDEEMERMAEVLLRIARMR